MTTEPKKSPVTPSDFQIFKEWAYSIATDLANKYSEMFETANAKPDPRDLYYAELRYPIKERVKSRLDLDSHGKLKELTVGLDLTNSMFYLCFKNPATGMAERVSAIWLGDAAGSLANFKNWWDEGDAVEEITMRVAWMCDALSIASSENPLEF